MCSGQEPETERSGLVYCIGRVEKTIQRAALIDLGDAHTLSVAPPGNKVAVFRATEARYVPIGVLTVAETFATSALTLPSAVTQPKVGDVVMFVRELSELKGVSAHRDDFIREQMVKNANQSEYTTMRRFASARTLRNYAQQHPKWIRSRAKVVGFLNGESYAEGKESHLTPLLNYIGMVREDYRVGRNSLSAAGKKWNTTVTALIGPTAMQQHQAAQPIAQDDDPTQQSPTRPPDRDVRRMVRERFFDRSDEEQNVLSYMMATLLEYTPRNQDVWFRNQVLRSQFPELADEEFVLEEVRELLRDLNENDS